jgi:glutathione S-transferase
MSFELYVDSLFTSPYALSVFVALTEKRLPFTVKTVDLAHGEQHQAAYAGRALTARVPALVEGDFVLTESTAITEYLDETFPAPEYLALYPKDKRQRAKARQVQAWVRSDLLAVRAERDTLGRADYDPVFCRHARLHRRAHARHARRTVDRRASAGVHARPGRRPRPCWLARTPFPWCRPTAAAK